MRRFNVIGMTPLEYISDVEDWLESPIIAQSTKALLIGPPFAFDFTRSKIHIKCTVLKIDWRDSRHIYSYDFV